MKATFGFTVYAPTWEGAEQLRNLVADYLNRLTRDKAPDAAEWDTDAESSDYGEPWEEDQP